MDQKTSASSGVKVLNSEAEWLNWRQSLIGSSDAPIVLGISEFMTPRQLWEVKLGLKKHEQSNMAIEKGKHWEPKVRALYELQTGLEFPPKNVEDKPLGASLDGFNEEHQIILEIKVPGKEVFEQAKAGKVHEKYVYQLEHQLFITGAKEAHFVCAKTDGKGAYDGKITELAVVVYKSDPEKRAKMLEAEQKFWTCIETKTPPPLTDRDVLERHDKEAQEAYAAYKALHEEYEKIMDEAELVEEQLSQAKQKLIQGMRHCKEECLGVQVTKVQANQLDRDKVKAAGIDLEQYQKPMIYYRVKVLK